VQLVNNPTLEVETIKEPKDDITLSEPLHTSPVEPSLYVPEPYKTEPIPNEEDSPIEEISDPSDIPMVTEFIIQETISSSPEQPNTLEDKNMDINFSVTDDNLRTTTPKKIENSPNYFSIHTSPQILSLNEQPNLNETPIREISSLNRSDPLIEKTCINLSETEPIEQPENYTPLPDSRDTTENISENSCMIIASPKPIITPAITSSPCLLMSPSLFGGEHLFKTEFKTESKNSVLDFLLPSPVNSTPSDNQFKPEEPFPMEEDSSYFR